MIKFSSSRTYIIVTDKKELETAKQCDLCMHIVWEISNIIHMWDLVNFKWVYSKYVAFGLEKIKDYKTTGFEAYCEFYNYCGKKEVERMKGILPIIGIWESVEQMHYFNLDFAGIKIYEPIYEFDVNSSFTYGVTKLPSGFEPLKEYMVGLFNKRLKARTKKERSRYKNLMVYLIGYFARIKEFVAVRSAVISNSNDNIYSHIIKIRQHGGTVFLSNTDSIITNHKGAEVMFPESNELGKFKLSTFTDKLYYRSSNAYQLGEKVVHSGVNWYERQHTDLFKGQTARSKGKLITGYDFELNELSEEVFYHRVCKVQKGEIIVSVYNCLGELLDKIIYKLGE